MNIDVDSMIVTHNEPEQRFEAVIDGRLALADYRRQGNTIFFTHTEVPEALEGNGIAGKIVQTALDYARTEQLSVVPLCPFVTAYIRRNQQYADLVAPEYLNVVQRQRS